MVVLRGWGPVFLVAGGGGGGGLACAVLCCSWDRGGAQEDSAGGVVLEGGECCCGVVGRPRQAQGRRRVLLWSASRRTVLLWSASTIIAGGDFSSFISWRLHSPPTSPVKLP